MLVAGQNDTQLKLELYPQRIIAKRTLPKSMRTLSNSLYTTSLTMECGMEQNYSSSENA